MSVCEVCACEVGLRARWCGVHRTMHYMRYRAGYVGKSVPSWEQLLELEGDNCAECGRALLWFGVPVRFKERSASLDHLPNGGFQFVCVRCNRLRYGSVCNG